MEYRKLGNTDINVSAICLGTMTWGEQNTEKEGHEQLNYAVSKGINFIDTAELYSVPGSKATYGSTEKIIGTWLKSQNRKDFVIASKIAGPSPGLAYMRNGNNFSNESIDIALGQSLDRLQTDYLDLYQLHWPERKTNCFGKLNYVHDDQDSWEDNMLEVVEKLSSLIKEGKIKHYGLSNETPWGTMRFIYLAKQHGLPEPVSIQNPYNLLNRSFEIGLSEIAIREKCGLLAYSPLGFGVLSGKYRNNQMPDGSRVKLFPNFNRYGKNKSYEAVEEYANIADKYNISLTELALAFVTSRDFVTSNIIGATTMEQLKENIGSFEVAINQEILHDVEEVFMKYQNTAP